MSVQAGIWNLDGRPVDQVSLEKFSSAIEQYGPDGGNIYVGGSIGIVYRAFHTTTESRLEIQPHGSTCGNVFTWDGRLDNRDDLIRELYPDFLNAKTDLAIVIGAYEKWGTDCFTKLVGDWALCVWNAQSRVLLLARDYIGIRHLYYCVRNKAIFWCTNLAPLLALGLRFNVSDEYVAGYLAAYPEPYLTPYREILAVPPGKFVRIDPAKTTVHPYWTPKFGVKIFYRKDSDYEEHFRNVFRRAVCRRLRSHAPIMAELSGGLDSSSIVCMADDIMTRGEGQTPFIHTFSFYDTWEPQGDERPYFTQIENARGRSGFHIDLGQYNQSMFQDLRGSMTVPGALWDSRLLEKQRYALMQSCGSRASLSGIGGDEFMGAVPDPRPQLADLIVQIRLAKLWKGLVAWSLVKRQPWIKLLFQSALLLLPLFLRARLTKEAKIGPWINSRFARQNRLPTLQLDSLEGLGMHLPSRLCTLRTLHTLAGQMLSVQPPLIGCEEKRYPFLDQGLVEFVLAIPTEQLLRPTQRRSLMRRALVNIVPHEILNRPGKGMAARRYMVGLETKWEELESLFTSSISAQLGYVEECQVRDNLRAVRGGNITQMFRILKAISLEIWLRDLVGRDMIHVPKRRSENHLEAFAQSWT